MRLLTRTLGTKALLRLVDYFSTISTLSLGGQRGGAADSFSVSRLATCSAVAPSTVLIVGLSVALTRPLLSGPT